MRWTTKARIQECMDRLPASVSRPLYFRMQRHFGNLRRSRIIPTSRLLFGMEFCRQIVAHGCSPRDADFMEVGTGWRLNTPIACWLCGARSVMTLDLNPYLRFSLIEEDLQYLQQNEDEVLSLLVEKYADLLSMSRWRRLIEHRPTNMAAFADLCGIVYTSPADARHTGRPEHSVDFHVSCNVFEHIPRDDLRDILNEANRVVKPTGLLLHRIDHTDHLSHSDASISPIHFLQFTDAQWSRYAGGRYSYVNRLREDDYASLFQECGQKICDVYSQSDAAINQAIRQGCPLDVRFRGKSPETLSRLTSLFVAAPNSNQCVEAA